MRILYLNPSGELGGAERVLLDIFGSIREAEPGWALHLIASENGPLIREASAINITSRVCTFPSALARMGDTRTSNTRREKNGNLKLFVRLLATIPSVMKYVLQLRSLIHEIKPDIIHSNGLKMHILAVLAARKSVPVIWHIHEFIGSRPITSRLLRRYSSRCSRVIVNSESVKQDVLASCGNRMQIKTIYNGIDLSRFSASGNVLNLDVLSGMPPSEPGTVRIGLLGTLGIWKGHEVFLQALARLSHELPFRAYIIGGPVYQPDGSQWSMEQIKDSAARLGIKHRVGFTGFVEDSPAAIRALDILVHASTQPEPFGLVIVEGMACERAVIASNSGGAAEIIQPGINAMAHPMRDDVALAASMAELIQDPQKRSRLGAAGRKTAEMHFNRSRFAKELIPMYCAIASTK